MQQPPIYDGILLRRGADFCGPQSSGLMLMPKLRDERRLMVFKRVFGDGDEWRASLARRSSLWLTLNYLCARRESKVSCLYA